MKQYRFLARCVPYIFGLFGIALIGNSLQIMLIYRYDPGISNANDLPLLVPSALVGSAMLISRTGSALAQPFVGYLSDRFQSRWGRRRPFLAVSVLPLVVGFIFLFNPPIKYSIAVNFIYLIVVLCLSDFAGIIYMVPYHAWLPTLAVTDQQRITLSTFRGFFAVLGAAMGIIAAPWITQVYGFRMMAITIGCLSFVTMLMPLTLAEDSTSNLRTSSELRPTFWKSIQSTWHNEPFRLYIGGVAGASIAASILSACPTFVAVALLHKDISFAGIIGGTFLVSSVFGLTLVIPLAKLLGKSSTLQWSMVWFGSGLILLGIWPFIVATSLMPWLGLIFIANLGIASLFSLPSAILPDVIAQDSLGSKSQQDAVYFGMSLLLLQISQGIGSLLIGMILMLGKTSEQPWGVQLAFPIAGIFAFAAAWSFANYPIKK